MLDETSDSATHEQLSVCVRYVNKECEVCEQFIGFLQLKQMDAQSIFNVIMHCLTNLSGFVGLGFDGASVMSGKKGVQKLIRDICPWETYVHCCSHVLNLSVAGAF